MITDKEKTYMPYEARMPNHPLATPEPRADMTSVSDVCTMVNQVYRGQAPPISQPPQNTVRYTMPAIQQQGVSPQQPRLMEGAPKPQPQGMYYFMKEEQPQAMRAGYSPKAPFDVTSVRKDFPLLQRRVHGQPLVWLDNAATTQKPQCVMDALRRYYSVNNSNVHRGAHELAREATEAYEEAREKVRVFIGASSKEEIVFVRGTTEAINLVANSWGMANLSAGDEIIITEMEHHSNIVPWQMLAQKTGAVLKAAPINEHGEVMLEEYSRMFTSRTRLVAAAHVSNVLGTVNPIRKMADIAHWHGALMLVDGAQSAPHMPINVQELGADFFAFSGHKVYGPTGIGVLFGRKALLEHMQPYQGGGGMIKNVTLAETEYEGLPYKFEAGTGNIADAVGLGAAIDYLRGIGMERINQHEAELTQYLMDRMQKIPNIRLIGTSPEKTSVVSFVMDAMSAEAVAKKLDQQGIAIRAGHHCAQPVMHRYGVGSTVRASLGLYNTKEELDQFVRAIYKLAAR